MVTNIALGLFALSASVSAGEARICRSFGQGLEQAQTETRLLQPGDKWSYEVTTRYPYTETWNTVTNRWEFGDRGGLLKRHKNIDYRGTLSIKVIQAPDQDSPTKLAFLKNLKFSRKDKDIDQTWLIYFEQEADTKKVTVYKKDEASSAKSVVGCLLPGNWSEGESFQSVPLYGISPKMNSSVNGGLVEQLESFSSVVSGSEKIKVKAGQFGAWKLARTTTLDTDYSDNVWFAPEIGYFLKLMDSSPTGDVNFPKCLEIIELDSTNVTQTKSR